MKGSNLDPQSVIRFANITKQIVGEKWVNRKIQEWKKRPQSKKNWKNIPAKVIPQHQLIYWFTEYYKWHKAGEKTGRYDVSAIVIKLAFLGRALDLVKAQKNFQKLVPRIKSQKEFLAAAFEIEVAASYVKLGWGVEFVEEKNTETPDLKVTKKDRRVFWVECKRRDELSQRDRLIKSIWDEVEQVLLDKIRPQKLNYFIGIKAIEDPRRKDIQLISGKIFEIIELIELNDPQIGQKEPVKIQDFENNFELVVYKMSNPDQPLDHSLEDFLDMDDYDRGAFYSEMMKTEHGHIRVYNPAVITMGTVLPPDQITGVIHAFHSAVNQIPCSGPGVIWIRVPDNSLGVGVSKFDQLVRTILQKEMTGEHNQRVNIVAIRTWVFRDVFQGGSKGLSYGPHIIHVEHTNPRVSIS